MLSLLLLSGCVYLSSHTLEGACAQTLGSPIRNFCVVTPGVIWRGERPTKADATWLLEHGVRSVFSLQLDAQSAFESARPADDVMFPVTYFRMGSLGPLQMLNSSHLDERIARFLAVVSEAPKPLYVHCRAGVDRAGVLIAVYRMLVEGVSEADALAEMERFHSPWLSLEEHYIHGLSTARRAQILRSAEMWKSRVRPLGQFECRSGTCALVRAPDASCKGKDSFSCPG